MAGELTKLTAEISSSPLLSNSVSGLIGLLGAVVGGLITALASAAGVRRSVAAQLRLQDAEWQRRDRERKQERQDRDAREKDHQEREGTAAVQALAVETLWNSIFLLAVAKQVETSADPAPHIKLSREQFDKHFVLVTQRLQGVYMQQTVSTYLSAFSLQQSREVRGRLPISEAELKRVNDLSTSFMIIFRTLGQRVFSSGEMRELEMTRTVAEASQ